MAITGNPESLSLCAVGIARSRRDARSNYVEPFVSPSTGFGATRSGNVIATTDLTDVILIGSLHVSPSPQRRSRYRVSSSCGLRTAPAPMPAVGDEIRIAWTTGGGATLFHGFVVIAQADWRLGNLHPPWIGGAVSGCDVPVRCPVRDLSIPRAIGERVDCRARHDVL